MRVTLRFLLALCLLCGLLPGSVRADPAAGLKAQAALMEGVAAPAATTANQPATEEELRHLLASLEDDSRRTRLIADIKALIAAQAVEQAATPEGVIDRLTAPIQALGEQGAATALLALLVALSLSFPLWRLADRLFSLKARSPIIEARMARLLPLLRWPGRVGVLVALLLGALRAAGLPVLSWLAKPAMRQGMSETLVIASVLLGAIALWEVTCVAVEHALSSSQPHHGGSGRGGGRRHAGISARTRTLLPLLRTILMVVLILFIALFLLARMGVDIAPVLAGAGVVGLAIGFGSQKLVQDVITGFFILVEDTMAVGDSVTLGDHSGDVEAISIRSIRLRDIKGQVHTIPFSAVNTVINQSRDYGYHLCDLAIGYGDNIAAAMEAMTQVAEDMRQTPEWEDRITHPLEMLGLERFEENAIILRARLRTRAGDQFAAGRDFNLRVKARFDALGLGFPHPIRTLYLPGAEQRAGQLGLGTHPPPPQPTRDQPAE